MACAVRDLLLDGSETTSHPVGVSDLRRRVPVRGSLSVLSDDGGHAYNDMLAIGFIAALHASGISVPAQVSVVGIDDIQFSSLVTPALTTIRLPRRQVAAKAVEELSARLHHLHEGNLRPVILPSRFIQRPSTGSAPQTIVHQ